jgi:hypothetical protein
MPRLRLVLLVVLFLLLPATVRAQEHRCANQPEVVVTTTDSALAEEVCGAAQQAISFLQNFDLAPKRAINFQITDEKIDSHGYSAYGSYDSRSDCIQLMSYAAILASSENPQMYGEPFDKVHYRGAIAHEVTHAVVQHNLKTKPLSTGPQEYLAHATQLAVLPEARRAAVIRAMDIGAWESGDAISDIYMAIEPGKFAVKSYKHLTGLLEPLSFVQVLLNAKWFYVYVP